MRRSTTEQIQQKFRPPSWPGFGRHIVATGFVEQIDVRDGFARIGFQLRTRETDEVAAMEAGARPVDSSLPGVEPESMQWEPARHWALPGRVVIDT